MPSTNTDPTRRAFLRSLAADAANATRTVYGTSGLVKNLVGEVAEAAGGPYLIGQASGPATSATSSVPDVFHIRDHRIVIRDQRAWPEIVEIECRHGADVSRALRTLAVQGPIIGVIAAYGLALTARLVQDAKTEARRGTLRGAAFLLRAARPSSGHVDNAVERLESCWPEAASDESGKAEAVAAWASAVALGAAAAEAEDRLCAIGAAALPETPGRDLQIMTLGSTGAMSGARRGTALGIVRAARERGRDVHVWLLETRPWIPGARIAAAELEGAGIGVTVIADSSSGAVLSRNPVDMVLVGAERIAPTGDFVGIAGTYSLAVLAARHAVPFWVAASSMTISARFEEGTPLPLEDRPLEEAVRSLSWLPAWTPTDAFVPLVDETPAALVTTFATEHGLASPPFLVGQPMRP